MVWMRVTAPAFFQGKTLVQGSHADLILAGQLRYVPSQLTLPDSREATIIAPDLSNLPPGVGAVDARTGENVAQEPEEPEHH